MARKKRIPESVCRHESCGKPIYYSDFTGHWHHWHTALESCGLVAEPAETPEQPQFSSEWGVT